MTEAGEKWVESLQGEASSFDISEAEFWLRAFCDEVEKRAQTKQVERLDTKLFLAFRELKRDLLGEEK